MADVPVALQRAATVVGRHLRVTPLVAARGFDAHLKLECHQQTGAYKVRGALNALTAQLARGDTRPVVAASAGNHAAGVAWAARALGLQAVAVVPANAPQSKIERTRALGAVVIRVEGDFAAAERHAQALAHTENYRLLHPFDDPDIIAGQATVGLELRPHRPDVVVVPIGGGGLAAGVALAFAGTSTRVVGVQVRASDRMASVADGVRVARPGRRNRSILRRYLSEWRTVSDREVREAMRALYERDGLTVEGAGAVAAAALSQVSGTRRVAVVSGGNVDPQSFQRALYDREPSPPRRRAVEVR